MRSMAYAVTRVSLTHISLAYSGATQDSPSRSNRRARMSLHSGGTRQWVWERNAARRLAQEIDRGSMTCGSPRPLREGVTPR